MSLHKYLTICVDLLLMIWELLNTSWPIYADFSVNTKVSQIRMVMSKTELKKWHVNLKINFFLVKYLTLYQKSFWELSNDHNRKVFFPELFLRYGIVGLLCLWLLLFEYQYYLSTTLVSLKPCYWPAEKIESNQNIEFLMNVRNSNLIRRESRKGYQICFLIFFFVHHLSN